MTKKYVKKHIPIEAEQFQPQGEESWDDAWRRVYEFSDEVLDLQFDDMTDSGEEEYYVYDYLHDSWIQFHKGDWILKGIRGEYYPCEREVFAETYEEAPPF